MNNIIKNTLFKWPTALLLMLVALYTACSMDNGDDYYVSELGATQGEYILPVEEGSQEIEIYTDQTSLDLKVIEEIDWLTVPSTVSDLKDGSIKFDATYQENTGFPRMATIAIFAPGAQRADTILLKQRGTKEAKMAFKLSSMTVLGSTASEVLAELDTNLEFEDIDIEVTYTGDYEGEDWIKDNFALEAEALKFSTLANPSATDLRTAKISLTHIDGWGKKVVSDLFLTQGTSEDKFASEIHALDLRERAGGKIDEFIYIEGHIVGDVGNMNVGDTPNTTPTNIDYTQNDRTSYIQTLDGKYGFRILTKTAEDNIFSRYSKVQILLKDTNIDLDEDPDRYTISGVTSDMVLSAEAGTASDIAKKEKYIKDLTDDDIYTQVTLKDLEFPIRKGSLTPINEGYSIDFGANRIAKYPLIMRDINGDNIHLMTNTKCTYRRDGSTLPYGSGKVTGIIVHETFTRFNYQDTPNEDTWGQIGRYQIRHLTKEEIDLAPDFENGFSKFLVEYRYYNFENGALKPTNPEGVGQITVTGESARIAVTSDYSYLGPIGKTNLGNLNGNGVVKEDGSKLSTHTSTNSDGKGAVNAGDNSSWQCINKDWWNYEKERGEAWLIEISTQGVSKQLSLQLSTMNWTQKGAPRYWHIEWAEDPDMDKKNNWKRIASYSVPDVANWANTLMSQLPGQKAMDFLLPMEMLGKEKVYIRLIVAENKASDSYSYDEAKIATTEVGNVLGYVAIRYNK